MSSHRAIAWGALAFAVVAAATIVTSTACRAPRPAPAPASADVSLASGILADADLPLVLGQARELLRGGLNAGTGYGHVWIRDLNTFVEMALEVNDPPAIRAALLTFFKFQGASGDIPDGFMPSDRVSGRLERRSALAPGLLAHKNTVETDQESSLVQAVHTYVTVTGDRSLLDEQVGGRRVIDRLGQALNYVMTERFDPTRGLVWGATTADWGDVQPETANGVELDRSSHRAIDIYDNAMLAIAIHDYIQLLPRESSQVGVWTARHADLMRNIREHLWDTARQKFIPHIYLAGSPFPKDFDEAAIYFHGGTAVAIEAGILTEDEIVTSLAAINDNVRKAGASSVGLSIYPAYPQGFFKSRAMAPYDYQNGGDWCWFGGRLVQQLIRHGLVREAYTALKPMVARVRQRGDFYEFWSLDNQPRGSSQFRGSAGVLGRAIEEILAWADVRRVPLSR